MKAGIYPEGIRCRHKGKPAEPFADHKPFGYIQRITPAGPGTPAQAFVNWGDFLTWEKLTDVSVQ